MKLIVNADKNWAIGRGGDLIFPIPEDMKFFRETTKGKTVIMGRKTLESFPNGQPLKNRTNIVLSRKGGEFPEGVISVRSVEELEDAVSGIPEEELFVIGGAEIYRLLLNRCDEALITRVDAVCPDPDSFIPNFDELPDWVLAEQSEEKVYDGVTFRFCTYRRAE